MVIIGAHFTALTDWIRLTIVSGNSQDGNTSVYQLDNESGMAPVMSKPGFVEQRLTVLDSSSLSRAGVLI